MDYLLDKIFLFIYLLNCLAISIQKDILTC